MPRRTRPIRVAVLSCCAAMLPLLAADKVFAQLPAGSTATVTLVPPVNETVLDPNTGTASTETTKQTILDLKHQDMTQFSQCTGELILINGHARFTFSSTSHADGSVTFTTHQDSAGTGTGLLTGWKYTYNMTSQSLERLSATDSDQLVVAHENLIRQGEVTTPVGGDDQWLHTNLHVTFVDGQPIPRVDRVEFQCR